MIENNREKRPPVAVAVRVSVTDEAARDAEVFGAEILAAGEVRLAGDSVRFEVARPDGSIETLDLDGLRGLGPATTRIILQEREREPFRDWQDLMKRTPGIGPKKAVQLSEQGLRVQGLAFAPAHNR